MYRLLRRHLPLLIALVVLALCLQSVAVACPTCKQGVAHDHDRQAGLVRGYFWSIVFMMSMPFLILAGLSGYFYYEIRRARARQALLGAPAAARRVAQPSA